jgi:hypothetical protein
MEAAANEMDLAGAITKLLARLERTGEDVLWDAEDIGIYMRLSTKSVQNHVITAPGFPNAIVLVTGGRRWYPKEVKAWVARRR